jgi:YD repeat-containing protein
VIQLRSELTSSYYVDGQVAAQTQNGETIAYNYDPAGRTRETVSSGKTAATAINHYAGPGEALTWASEGAEKWTRNIPGLDGALDAIQTNAGTPVLQLHDLQGNIVATVKDSETETKPGSTYNSTEFGVPQPGTTPPKYAWLGANGLATELSSGVATKGGASYVPQVARNLQTAAIVPPGAFPNGIGTESVYTSVIPGWATAVSNEISAGTLAEYAAKLEAARKKAEQEALEAEERYAHELAENERIAGEENPTPTEGGAEEGEISVHGIGTATTAEAGPPVITCGVAAWTPTKIKGGEYYFSADLICDGAPSKSKLKVCGQQLISGIWTNLACSDVREGTDAFLLLAGRNATCTPGSWIRSWAWGWGVLGDGSESSAPEASGEVKCV